MYIVRYHEVGASPHPTPICDKRYVYAKWRVITGAPMFGTIRHDSWHDTKAPKPLKIKAWHDLHDSFLILFPLYIKDMYIYQDIKHI